MQATAHQPETDSPLVGDDLHVFHWFASVTAAVVFALSLGLLVVASRLDAAPTGVGTHSQLGMAPCGFLDRTGMPCATCGMTTSFALAADGRLIDAFFNQPAGALLALLTAIVALLSAYAMVKGMSLMPLVLALWKPMTIAAIAIMVLGAWGYKILIMQGI